MTKNKKIIIIVSIIIVLMLCIAAAVYFLIIDKNDKTPTLQETVDNRIAAYGTDLTDSMSTMTDQSSVLRYLVTWAENKGIEVKTDDNGNVIYSISATEEFKDNPPVVILCGYDYTNMNSYINSLTCALTVAKNDAPHGEYKIIFVSEENGNKNNVKALSNKYFTPDTKVFCLSDTYSSRIALSTGGFNKYTLSKELQSTETSYDKTYKVTISGLPANGFISKYSSVPNPIKTLGNLLANFKSTSILFELASFTGGGNISLLPQEASIIIVVNEDSSEKLERNLQNAIDKFTDKYSEDYPDLQYTFEVVDTPSKVIKTEDAESIVSLLYTATDGVHYKDDDGEIASITNIGSISTENNMLNIEIAAASYDSELISEISSAYETISALTDVKYNCTELLEPFKANENGEALSVDFSKAYNRYQNIKLDKINIAEWTPCFEINTKAKDMAVISFGVTERTKDNFAGGLITYLQTKAEKE